MSIKNILCVDDELPWRQIFKIKLREYLTLSLDVAENYKSALEKIRATHYDLIIVDGLEGDCFRIYQDIQNIPHGDIIIFSANYAIEQEAERRGLNFCNKSEAENLFDRIVSQYK